LATKRQQNIFCRQSLRRRRWVKRPLKTNAEYGPPIPSASADLELSLKVDPSIGAAQHAASNFINDK
jgi:hypothetical protein